MTPTRTIAGIGVGTAMLFGAATMPLIPSEMEWHQSYETVRFDTSDGDLGINEYAVRGEDYFVRTAPKNQSNFIITQDEKAIAGKSEVGIVCDKCQYYSEFKTSGGKIVRVPEVGEKYNRLRSVKGELQPTAIERKNLIESFNVAEAAITGSATTTQLNTAASSISWAHSVAAGTDDLLVLAGTENTAILGVATYDAVTMDVEVDRSSPAWGDLRGYVDSTPSTGSNTVVVNINQTDHIVGVAITLTGVDQITSTSSGATPNATYSTTSVTTTVDGSWAFYGYNLGAVGADCAISSPTPNAGDITLAFFEDGVASLEAGFFVQQDITPAGAVVLGNDLSCSGTSNVSDYISIVFAPVAAAAEDPTTPQSEIWFD